MKIEIIGDKDRTKSTTLFSNTLEALKSCGVDGKVVLVNDIQTILKYGVMLTPALVVNGIVLFSGRFGSLEEITVLLQQSLPFFM